MEEAKEPCQRFPNATFPSFPQRDRVCGHSEFLCELRLRQAHFMTQPLMTQPLELPPPVMIGR